MAIFIGIIFVIVLLFWFIKKKENQRKQEKGYLETVHVTHVSGIQGLSNGANVRLDLYPDKLMISDKIIIPLNRIKYAASLMENQLIEKHKSVIGRAIVGGVLFAGVGAIVGGLTGVGTKKKKKRVNFLSIDYTTKEGSTEVSMFVSPNKFQLDNFSKKINEIIGHTSIGNTPYEI